MKDPENLVAALTMASTLAWRGVAMPGTEMTDDELLSAFLATIAGGIERTGRAPPRDDLCDILHELEMCELHRHLAAAAARVTAEI